MKYGETGVPCTFYKKGLWFAPKVKVNNTQKKERKTCMLMTLSKLCNNKNSYCFL
jgi:hypothetical protein